MPWTDKPGGSGNNGSGGRGPWGAGPGNDNGGSQGGRGPRGGGQPDLEELFRSSRDRFKRSMGDRGGDGGGPGFPVLPKLPLFLIAAAVLAVILVSASVYQVQAQQVAVVTTFGKYTKLEGPGLKFLIPFVQDKEFVDVAADRSNSFGVTRPGDSSMLTKDLNIANVTFTVNWRVPVDRVSGEDGWPGPANFALKIEKPEDLLQSVAEAAVREVVGATDFDPLITSGRNLVPQEMKRIMQEALDSYNSGIEILSVNYDQAQPPAEVLPFQRDVIDARSEKQQKINDATAYANQQVPQARGLRERLILDAEAYRAQSVAEARGAAARFNDIYEEYAKNPDITRQRMYLETMERVLGEQSKIILDNEGGGGPVPYLSLNELQRNQRGNQ